ncbi:hypothetical protein D3C76_1341030 [compost metagenome]
MKRMHWQHPGAERDGVKSMTLTKETDIQLRQALISLMAAAEQLGIPPEVLRLTAVGVLTKQTPDWWVDATQVVGSIRELNLSVEYFIACSAGKLANTDCNPLEEASIPAPVSR